MSFLSLIKELILSSYCICFLFLWKQANLHSSIFKNGIYSFPDTNCICGDTIIKRLYMVSGSMKFTFQPNKQEMIIQSEKHENMGNSNCPEARDWREEWCLPGQVV